MLRAAVHILAGIVGAAIIACVTDASITASGGYQEASARLMVALACGLAIGSIALGVAWNDRRWTIVVCLILALVSGEAYSLVLTAERVLARRDAAQEPLKKQEEARARLNRRLRHAETAVKDLPAETPRLARALAAKLAADNAVVQKAAEKGCAANCRALLEQQVVAAATEADAARAEMEKLRSAAEREVTAAGDALDAAPRTGSASPLAERLGIADWKLDLAMAALASIAANGLAAVLIAFAAHGQRPQATVLVEAEPRETRKIMRQKKIASAEQPAADKEADCFAKAMFVRPRPDGRVHLRDIREAYHAWCESCRSAPLPDHEIGAALNDLFSSVGLYREGNGKEAAIVGIGWKAKDLGGLST